MSKTQKKLGISRAARKGVFGQRSQKPRVGLYAAIYFNNLCEFHLSLGGIAEAIAAGRQSVELADRSGDAFERMAGRTTCGDAFHQSGNLEEAARLFDQAERPGAEEHPQTPYLTGLGRARYCELLLGICGSASTRRTNLTHPASSEG